jgi:hypothetical protein
MIWKTSACALINMAKMLIKVTREIFSKDFHVMISVCKDLNGLSLLKVFKLFDVYG